MKNLLQAAKDVLAWFDADDGYGGGDVPFCEFREELQETIDYGIHVYSIPSIEDAPLFWDEEKAIDWLIADDESESWYKQQFRESQDKRKNARFMISIKQVI